jgi:hypothetical protein
MSRNGVIMSASCRQKDREMAIDGESVLRMALRHVQEGRRCIQRQHGVISTLRDRGLPTGQAEDVLHALEETQRQFEDDYNDLLSGGLRRIELMKEKFPDGGL